MRSLLISAQTVIGSVPLALQSVYYPTLLGAYARAVRGRAKLVVAVATQHAAELRARLSGEGCADDVTVVDALPAAAEGDLRFDLSEVFIPGTLRTALASGKLDAPVWKIRENADVARAAATLERHDMYVVARYLVIPVARRLATALLPTRYSPNTVTAWSCLCGVAAAVAPFMVAGLGGRALAALLVHLSITLDFTDGYLARLRATDSRTGYWFDTMMDEVVKFSLFICMSLLAIRGGAAWTMVAAILVLLLYHVLTCNHWLSKSLEQGDVTASAASVPLWRPGTLGVAKRAYERLNYLDVHLYICALALLVSAEAWALLMFAVVYTFRFVRMLQVRLAGPSTVS